MKNIWRIEFLSDLCDCIGCDEESLEKAIEEKDKYYGGKISIPKKNGYRHIYKVNKVCRLYDIQKNLCVPHFNFFHITSNCHAIHCVQILNLCSA